MSKGSSNRFPNSTSTSTGRMYNSPTSLVSNSSRVRLWENGRGLTVRVPAYVRCMLMWLGRGTGPWGRHRVVRHAMGHDSRLNLVSGWPTRQASDPQMYERTKVIARENLKIRNWFYIDWQNNKKEQPV